MASSASRPRPLAPGRIPVTGWPRPLGAWAALAALLALASAMPVQAQAPYLVKDINPLLGGPGDGNPAYLAAVGSQVFFRGCDLHGCELWKSDGTAAGTVLVKDIYPGATGSDPCNLTNVNGTLFFPANDGTNGDELWKSDGTAAGTVLVKDINPGASGSDPDCLTNVNGTLFFQADDGANGAELWKSDGTAAGTVLVKDINPGAASAPYPDQPDERQRHALLRGRRRRRTDASCGRATGRRRAPSWSRTSTPARQAPIPAT